MADNLATKRLIGLIDERLEIRSNLADGDISEAEYEATRLRLRSQARGIGQRLYDEGGISLMQSVCDGVWKHSVKHMSILNSWWNRIGGWMA